MRYLDANVFIFAVLDEGPRGDRARELLRAVTTEDEPAATSALAIDEVVWTLQGEGPREVAIREGQRLMGLPSLQIFDVTAEDTFSALSLMEDEDKLDPRDAIHAAVAIGHGVYTMVSDDPDLDAVPKIEREELDSAAP